MNTAYTKLTLGVVAGLALTSMTQGATIQVGDPTAGVQAADEITVDTVWTADNVYRLRDQIYVKNGATLTIRPGTLIASQPTANGSGSLAITRGSKIMACGTCESPIIFTSTLDVATWTGGDPHTGVWRPEANEWGNVTIMGKGLIGDYVTAGNSASCSSGNVKAMEGLTPQFAGDPNTLFGGGDDDDSSGCMQYVSLRYGGRVLGLGNELNGLSLGGIGRGTQIDHIDIMNNVDDGIEIWGGTVNLKYINIWNIGDDCFDVDCGWRGKAQFGLIVQGYSKDAGQGGGIGDNIFEMDGAEKADAQPNSAGCIYNFTVIGQPVAGDHGTAWRDEARMQFRQCIFMDLGEDLIHNDNTDGDSGSVGYTIGGGALTYAQIWTTPYTTFPVPNACASPATIYQAQSAGSGAIQQGFLAELTDSVFFRNFDGGGANPDGYSNGNGSNAVGVTTASGSNRNKGNVVAAYGGVGNPDLNMPIKTLNRHAVELLQGNTIPLIRVSGIDPRAANAAVTSVSTPPSDGFFNPATYRGAFSADKNWLCSWTACDAFGFLVKPAGACTVCCTADVAPYGRPDGQVNILDLTAVILGWGTSDAKGDVNHDGTVNILDLTAVILAWGGC